MKKLLASLLAAASLGLGLATSVQAAGGPAIAWDKAPVNLNDTAALQRGANILRVHDVKEAKECIRIFNQVLQCKGNFENQ